ncbi:hypothetical protein SE17_41720, partial [Kouleothrix aurantiaca]
MPQYLVTVRARHDAAAPQHLYLLDGELAAPDVDQLAGELLHDTVVQQAEWHTLPQLDSAPGAAAEVAFKPGVTDNEAESILIGARRLGIGGLRSVKTLRRYPLGAGETAPAGLY